MLASIVNIGKNIYRKIVPESVRAMIWEMRTSFPQSYSQCGEDRVIKFLAHAMPFPKDWSWLDIGAHHPQTLSNTALFYKMGIRGINVEADPKLIKDFHKKRKKDINLNIAVAEKSGTMEFYLMNNSTLNTLSKEEATKYEEMGYKIEEVITIPTMTVDDIVLKYNKGIFPELLLLDAEGYDLEILKTISWDKSIPKVICVENIPHNRQLKNYFQSMQTNELSEYLKTKGYSIIAFTLINAIFVHDSCMEKA